MTAIRDMQCSNSVAAMAALGRYKEEYISYGCSYYDDGKKMFCVSNDCVKMYRFVERKHHEGVPVGCVKEHLYRTMVPSGQREDISQNVKIDLAQNLNESYTENYFQVFETVQKSNPRTNSAKAGLGDYKEALVGRFDKDELTIFSGLVECAWQARRIDKESHSKFVEWIIKNKRQLEMDIVACDSFKATFYGFSYKNSTGDIKYKYNAAQEIILQQKERLEKNGTFCTPIYKQDYWVSSESLKKEKRKLFIVKLEEVYDKEYWQHLEEILPEKQCENLEALETLNSEEKTAIKLYLARLRYAIN